LRIPKHVDAGSKGYLMGHLCAGQKDILQSDPNTKHVVAALSKMANASPSTISFSRTAPNYAQRLPAGLTFLEKDGTFTNAERRISVVRKGDDAGVTGWPMRKSRQPPGAPEPMGLR